MKGTSIALTVTIALSSLALAQTALLDDAAVESAIRAGESKKFNQLISSCSAGPGFGSSFGGNLAGGIQPTGSFDVTIAKAEGRIAFMAAEGKRLYKPLKVSDVPDAVKDRNLVFVWAVPDKPKNNGSAFLVPAPIEQIVLKSKPNPNLVAQPTNIDLTPVEWKNLMGGTVQGNSAVATFSANDVREMPTGDIDVVLVTTAGERRCKIGNKDRTALFPVK